MTREPYGSISWETFMRRGQEPGFWEKLGRHMITNLESQLEEYELLIRLVRLLNDHDPEFAPDQVIRAAKIMEAHPELWAPKSESIEPTATETTAIPETVVDSVLSS